MLPTRSRGAAPPSTPAGSSLNPAGESEMGPRMSGKERGRPSAPQLRPDTAQSSTGWGRPELIADKANRAC